MATAQSTWVQGLLEKRRLQLTDGLRSFIIVDNNEAVKLGDTDKEMVSRPVVKPKFTTEFPEAVVPEGADEHRHHDCRRDNRWRPPLVDVDWHVICQAIFEGVEGPDWKSM